MRGLPVMMLMKRDVPLKLLDTLAFWLQNYWSCVKWKSVKKVYKNWIMMSGSALYCRRTCLSWMILRTVFLLVSTHTDDATSIMSSAYMIISGFWPKERQISSTYGKQVQRQYRALPDTIIQFFFKYENSIQTYTSRRTSSFVTRMLKCPGALKGHHASWAS